jgi:hypothetical protein
MIFVETEMMALAGVIAIESRTAGVTVSDADPEMPPNKEALMFVEPTLTDVARPFVPEALLMVATPVFEEFQVTKEETSWVVLSDSVAIAMNSWVVPSTMLGFAGVTVIAVMTAGVTVSVAELDVMLENVARTVVVPTLTAVANP